MASTSRSMSAPAKNIKRIRVETQTKKLVALCHQHYPSHNWRARRDQGRIFCNTISIAKLEPTSMDAATVIRWKQDALAK
eukprot:6543323-Pyramimonas_sp.AAC.1